ncbi:YadA C-terminal domain-containing protein [Salmonella enterica]
MKKTVLAVIVAMSAATAAHAASSVNTGVPFLNKITSTMSTQQVDYQIHRYISQTGTAAANDFLVKHGLMDSHFNINYAGIKQAALDNETAIANRQKLYAKVHSNTDSSNTNNRFDVVSATHDNVNAVQRNAIASMHNKVSGAADVANLTNRVDVIDSTHAKVQNAADVANLTNRVDVINSTHAKVQAAKQLAQLEKADDTDPQTIRDFDQDTKIQHATLTADKALGNTVDLATEDKANQTQTRLTQAQVDKNTSGVREAKTGVLTNAATIAANKADQGEVNKALLGQNIHQDSLIKANATEIATVSTDTHMLAKGLNNETDNRVAADSKLAGAVTSVAGHVATTEKLVNQQGKSIATLQDATGALGEKVVAADRTNVRQDSELLKVGKQQHLMSAQIENNRVTGEYAQSRADAAYANAKANREALDKTNNDVAQNSKNIADNKERITSLEQSTTSKFGALKSEVEQNRKRASAGIAGVAAMANIPQVTQGATFSVGAGVGNTDGESALAVGASARINDSWVVKGSVSNDTQHNFVVGAGASYQW